jgi:class 3 adenylate cyclase
MHAAIASLNEQLQLEPVEQLILTVGVHSGPCLNVTLNDRLDYFGTAVNIAARIQGLGQGRDLVLTDAVYESPFAQVLLGDSQVVSWRAMLKGIDEVLLVHRVMR